MGEGGVSGHESLENKKNPNLDSRKSKFAIFENFTNTGESIRDINEGSREYFILSHSNHRSWPWHGEKWWETREKKKCMPCMVARIYIVGSLEVLERGVRVRRNCNIFNLAMENVLKGLPDKISCPDIIHKCTSNVHIFLITFKLRDRGEEISFLYT